jgi:hypothetical protein
MKTVLLSILAVFSLIEVNADVIRIRTTSVRYFNHITGISTSKAIDQGTIKYLDYLVGKNTIVFDLDKKTVAINYQEPLKIIQVSQSSNLLDCAILDNGVRVNYTLEENETGDLCFLSEWEWEGKVNGYISSSSNFSFQIENEWKHYIDYDHFDNKLLERLVFEALNNYRDSLGVIDLLWSEEMYKYISCKQTEIIAKGSGLYHPDLEIKFTDEFRVALARESERLTGMKSYSNCSPKAVQSLSENAFSTDLYDGTYEALAKSAIIAWDKSIMHKINQKYHYLVNGGGKGFVSISARLNNECTKLFIFCNFSKVYKETLDLGTVVN